MTAPLGGGARVDVIAQVLALVHRLDAVVSELHRQIDEHREEGDGGGAGEPGQ